MVIPSVTNIFSFYQVCIWNRFFCNTVFCLMQHRNVCHVTITFFIMYRLENEILTILSQSNVLCMPCHVTNIYSDAFSCFMHALFFWTKSSGVTTVMGKIICNDSLSKHIFWILSLHWKFRINQCINTFTL